MSKDRAKAILAMTGMDTSTEFEHIRENLGKLEGLRRVEFDFIMDRVRIEYDPAVLTLERIRETLNQLGNEWRAI